RPRAPARRGAHAPRLEGGEPAGAARRRPRRLRRRRRAAPERRAAARRRRARPDAPQCFLSRSAHGVMARPRPLPRGLPPRARPVPPGAARTLEAHGAPDGREVAKRDSSLIWVFRRPLKRPGRLVALFSASIAAALLGGVSLTSAYPALVILFDPDWTARLREVASDAWPPLRPAIEGLAGLAAGQTPTSALALVLGVLLATLL